MTETSRGWTVSISWWRFASIVLFTALVVLGALRIWKSGRTMSIGNVPVLSAGDVAKLTNRSGINIVARTPLDMAEYVRCVILSRDGKEAESRELLNSLLDQKRVATVENGTSVMFLERFAGKPPRAAPYYVPWSRFVRVRVLDGAGAGLEVWTDDILLERVSPKRP